MAIYTKKGVLNNYRLSHAQTHLGDISRCLFSAPKYDNVSVGIISIYNDTTFKPNLVLRLANISSPSGPNCVYMSNSDITELFTEKE